MYFTLCMCCNDDVKIIHSDSSNYNHYVHHFNHVHCLSPTTLCSHTVMQHHHHHHQQQQQQQQQKQEQQQQQMYRGYVSFSLLVSGFWLLSSFPTSVLLHILPPYFHRLFGCHSVILRHSPSFSVILRRHSPH